MEPVIKIEGVNVYYDNVCALSNINLTVNGREFLGIIGPNGGGKTTLLKLILGLIKPSAGNIKIFEQPPDKAQKVIGYVPQFTKFDKRFPINVEDVVLMGRLSQHTKVFHQYTQEDRSFVKALMKKLEISDLNDRQIGQLSGGQLQRVLIARALAMEPRILLLDEPTASVDSHSKTQIYSLLKQLNEDVTIIIVTHDIGVVSSYINRIACLNRELYYHGETELNKTVIEKVYGCPVDLIGHGIPHRVLGEHSAENHEEEERD